MGAEYQDVVLASFHSISKGFYGECGRRGGYVELINTPADVFAELVKLASIDLCSNINGQICTALMMNPPQVCAHCLRWLCSRFEKECGSHSQNCLSLLGGRTTARLIYLWAPGPSLLQLVDTRVLQTHAFSRLFNSS